MSCHRLWPGSWLSAMPSTRNGFKGLNKVSVNISIQPRLRERDVSAYRSGRSEVLTYAWKIVIKRRRGTFALLSFVSFSKLVILVNTGQPVENNTAYARYMSRQASPNLAKKVTTTRPHGLICLDYTYSLLVTIWRFVSMRPSSSGRVFQIF
jgi:hypothetical protein